jgi:hypothetical protein
LDCVEGSGNNICVPGLFLIAVTVCLRITFRITSLLSWNFHWNHFLCRKTSIVHHIQLSRNAQDKKRTYGLCTISFGHCVFCSSSIYGFWLPLWYLQTLLENVCGILNFFGINTIQNIHKPHVYLQLWRYNIAEAVKQIELFSSVFSHGICPIGLIRL